MQPGRTTKHSQKDSDTVKFSKQRGPHKKPQNSLLQKWPGGKKAIDICHDKMGGIVLAISGNKAEEAPHLNEATEIQPSQVCSIDFHFINGIWLTHEHWDTGKLNCVHCRGT